MRISIIGAGNLAFFVGSMLSRKGHQIVEVWNRTESAGKELAHRCDAQFVQELNQLNTDVDAIFILVSDGVIESIASQLNRSDSLLVHCAGAVEAQVLEGKSNTYGVIWPLYSISKDNLPLEEPVPLIAEAGNAQSRPKISQLTAELSPNVTMVDFEQRKKLHLAAVLVNNFSNHLFVLAERLLSDSNLPFGLLRPIIKETFERLSDQSPHDLQTGPARRADKRTLALHEELLQNDPETGAIYRAVSASIMKWHSSDEMINKTNKE